DVIDFARLPDLFQFAVNLVFDARIQFDWAHICIQVKLLPVGDHLCESGELWLRIRLTGFRENCLAVDFMTNCAKDDRLSGGAFFKRPFRPFDLVLGIIVTAAGDLFNFELDLKELPCKIQNAQSSGQNFGPDTVTGQRYDVIGLFHWSFSANDEYKRGGKESTRRQAQSTAHEVSTGSGSDRVRFARSVRVP